MEISTETIHGVPVVSVKGEVDRLAGKPLKRAVAAVLQGTDAGTYILVDLSDCTYVDAVALSVLMSARDRLTPGSRLVLIGASDNIRNLFRVIGFEEGDSLHFLSSRAEAQVLIETSDARGKIGLTVGARLQKGAS